jgi:hypothetical protein
MKQQRKLSIIYTAKNAALAIMQQEYNIVSQFTLNVIANTLSDNRGLFF